MIFSTISSANTAQIGQGGRTTPCECDNYTGNLSKMLCEYLLFTITREANRHAKRKHPLLSQPSTPTRSVNNHYDTFSLRARAHVAPAPLIYSSTNPSPTQFGRTHLYWKNPFFRTHSLFPRAIFHPLRGYSSSAISFPALFAIAFPRMPPIFLRYLSTPFPARSSVPFRRAARCVAGCALSGAE